MFVTLLRLAGPELFERERWTAERRLKEGRLPAVKSLDSFDFLALPSLSNALVLELASGGYVKRREVIEVGNGGTGKTHHRCAGGCAHRACLKLLVDAKCPHFEDIVCAHMRDRSCNFDLTTASLQEGSA